MFDQVIDSVRKTTESSLKAQQAVFKQWIQDAAPVDATGPSAEWTDAARKQWMDTIIETLHTHRKALDAAYRSAIDVMEESFRLSESKSPEDYRTRVEGLWSKQVLAIKETSEAQCREYQKVTERWVDAVRKHA